MPLWQNPRTDSEGEPMTEDPYAKEKRTDGAAVANTVVGVLVLIFGVGVSIWVLSVVGQTIGGEDQLPVVHRIVSSVTEGDALSGYYNEKDIVAFGTVAGYLIVVFLLYIAAGIARKLIGAGASIMNPDYKKVLIDLKKELVKGKARK